MNGEAILTTPALNLDYFYFLIYSFFTSLGSGSFSKFFEAVRYSYSPGQAPVDLETYSKFGEGIGAFYDGYSLFRPPHGLPSFGGFSG